MDTFNLSQLAKHLSEAVGYSVAGTSQLATVKRGWTPPGVSPQRKPRITGKTCEVGLGDFRRYSPDDSEQSVQTGSHLFTPEHKAAFRATARGKNVNCPYLIDA